MSIRVASLSPDAILCFLVFCGYDSASGPHTLVCLTEFWLDAGCCESGQYAPANVDDTQLAYWSTRSVGLVKDDMALFHSYAVDGRQNYTAHCYG